MDIFEEIYGTNEKLASADGEEAVYEEVYAELEKVASANGIDLDSFSDDELVEMMADILDDAVATEKQASADEVSDEDIVKVAEADFLGRVQAHALVDELTKMSSAEDEDYDPVTERANEILAAAAELIPDDSEKTASDEDALNADALELLAENGYDVEAIVGLLSDED